MRRWRQLGISNEVVLDGIRKVGYKKPTPIQRGFRRMALRGLAATRANMHLRNRIPNAWSFLGRVGVTHEVRRAASASMPRSMGVFRDSDGDLPDGWQRCYDPSSKRSFFHDKERRVVSWAHPDRPEEDVFATELKKRRAPQLEVRAATVAPALRRVGAVVFDAAVSSVFGGLFAGAVYVDLGDPQASMVAFSFALWGSFVARDALFEQGTRSLGKRLMGLEIVTVAGQLPTRRHTILRNVYFVAYGGITAFGDLAPFLFALAAGDLLLLLFSPGRRKLGDWFGGTRVITECDDRSDRLEERGKRVLDMMSRG